ncbi:hypothetical protein SteCoe_21927 [Stentor coeruleus]|uniref:Uncharacterized protein n=1 Tax=Stentor coeruleus TaxID=5963 RepID=A0A1R2BP04_9CILI|nr:hypothetical protein SteCoe_21927 [Stentor coeruleus]
MSIAVEDLEFIRKKENIIYGAIELLNKFDRITNKSQQTEGEIFILKYLNNTDKLIKDLQEKHIEIIDDLDITKKNQELYDKIQKLQAIIDEKTQELKERLDQIEDKQKEFSLKSENLEILENIEKIEEAFKESSEVVSSYKERVKNIEKEFYVNEEDIESPYIHFFENNTKKLNTVNVASDRDQYRLYDMQDNMSYNGAFCQITKTITLFYGGITSSTIGHTYIIDTENQIATKQLSGKLGYCIGQGSFYKNAVYFFSGCCNQNYRDSAMFNLRTNTWHSIEPLPAAAHCNLSVPIGNKIVVTGYHFGCAYIYSIKNNYYKQFGSFQVNFSKILCKANKKIYLFEGSRVHESREGSIGQYDIVNPSAGLPNSWLLSFPTKYKDNIYFVLDNRSLYKMDLTTKAVVLIRVLNIVDNI